ncbi:response regulator [Rhodoferax sp.]|uniref:response regulator n=1 Tax=Rhodoferax sp. TaxID=50421 RepID=UPI0030161933
MKLLIVEDSDLIRDGLMGLFEGMPGVGSIKTTDTLGQTLQVVSHESPTMVILDLHLPDGNALRIIPLLKKLAPAMLIAVLTNDANDYNRQKCLAAGADWFFDKSIEFEALLETVQQHTHETELP